MGLLHAIGRAAPLIVGGVAAAWYLRRHGLLGGSQYPALPGPQAPPPSEPPATGDEVPAEAEPEVAETEVEGEVMEEVPGESRMNAHVEAVEAVSDAADVTAVVEDLLAVAPGEEAGESAILDAEVVEEPDDERLAEAVRVALAEQPGLLGGSVEVEVRGATAWLRGEVERPEAIPAAESRAAAVQGVREVRSLLHVAGTPPPSAGERR